MTLPGQSDTVNVQAIVHIAGGELLIRRVEVGDDMCRISPPGDGAHIDIGAKELVDALRVLGFNRADLFPDGDR
jgi:hypothetical protein